ncbi:cpsf4 [Symbiodinium pilosum]|uniref:Cpsf4 protein n=1 Tax=Symbiodinium pilosum TaxID=2952 RepID=A0A812L9M6_SYMPI|nr:cpsf4 [Symbiodinium pilosum]
MAAADQAPEQKAHGSNKVTRAFELELDSDPPFEVGASPVEESPCGGQEIVIQNKRQMCKAFFFTDWCAKGSMCPFAHSAEERIEELNQALPYKATLCRFFMAEGFCGKGDSCEFAHSDDELAGNVDQKSKMGLCKFHLGDGFCGKGRFCRYAHSAEELSRLALLKYKTRLCQKHFLHGSCSHGAWCTFAHTSEEQRPDIMDKVLPMRHVLCARFCSGFCFKGSFCEFAHQKREVSALQLEPVSAQEAEHTALLSESSGKDYLEACSDAETIDTHSDFSRSPSEDPPCPPREWTCDTVAEWMTYTEQGKFSRYADACRQNAVDGQKLEGMTVQDLKDILDVKLLGPRKALATAIDRLFAQ